MTAAMAMPGNTAETFLVHFFGTGLVDDRYVVERFRARADGDIVPAPAEPPRAKSGRKTKHTTATLKAVREMKALLHRDHHLHRSQDPRRHAGLGVDRGRPSLRPQAEGLDAPFRTSCRPGVGGASFRPFPDWQEGGRCGL